jgi:tetratricopeptide (TPR) repeat protein
MMRPMIKARMMVVGLTVGLACSELLAQGQSSLERARELVSIGSFDKAEAMLRQTIAADPNNVDARVLLGTTLALRENRNEAIEQLAEAVRLNPSSATAHNEFGMVLSRFVEVRAARQELERALELDPGLAEAHVNLSLVLAQAGELAAAGDHLDRAIELQGNHRKAAYAHYLRAKIWAAQDQTGKAMVEFQTAVHLRPNYAEAWSDLAARGVWSLPGRVFPCFHPHASAGKKDRHEPLGETAAATPPDSLT